MVSLDVLAIEEKSLLNRNLRIFAEELYPLKNLIINENIIYMKFYPNRFSWWNILLLYLILCSCLNLLQII